jgi:predicted transcriptional regulator
MSTHPAEDLGRRERQIMETVYRLGRATAREVLAQLPDPPSYSATRAMLKYLENKGHLTHEQDGARFVYLPTAGKEELRAGALKHLIRTFFDGSITSAVAALLDAQGITAAEKKRLAKMIADAPRQSGKERRR